MPSILPFSLSLLDYFGFITLSEFLTLFTPQTPLTSSSFPFPPFPPSPPTPPPAPFEPVPAASPPPPPPAVSSPRILDAAIKLDSPPVKREREESQHFYIFNDMVVRTYLDRTLHSPQPTFLNFLEAALLSCHAARLFWVVTVWSSIICLLCLNPTFLNENIPARKNCENLRSAPPRAQASEIICLYGCHMQQILRIGQMRIQLRELRMQMCVLPRSGQGCRITSHCWCSCCWHSRR